jgi:hypothetical protein
MPMVDDAQWALHQRAMSLLNKMADDPTVGTQFKRMAKQVDGTLRFTDLEAAEAAQKPLLEHNKALETRLAKIEADREAERQALEAEKHTRALSGDIQAAARKFSLTDDGLEKMKLRMTEKGSLDAEAAAAWVAAQAPKASPSESSGAFAPAALNLYGSAEKEEQWELLHTSPEKWQDAEIRKILAENPLAA